MRLSNDMLARGPVQEEQDLSGALPDILLVPAYSVSEFEAQIGRSYDCSCLFLTQSVPLPGVGYLTTATIETPLQMSLSFADSRLSENVLKSKKVGKRRFSQNCCFLRELPWNTAGKAETWQIGVCPVRFVPLSMAIWQAWRKTV